MKKKVIVGAWLMGLAAIVWSCNDRHGDTRPSSWLETLAARGAA